MTYSEKLSCIEAVRRLIAKGKITFAPVLHGIEAHRAAMEARRQAGLTQDRADRLRVQRECQQRLRDQRRKPLAQFKQSSSVAA